MKIGGYEAHLTMDAEHHGKVREIGETFGLAYSQITGCPILGQGTYCYLTDYSLNLEEVKQRIFGIKVLLEHNKIPVLRAKIEHIVFDTKTGVGV
jgi:DNA repair photolyase